MPRLSLQEVTTSAATLFSDNTTGQITPAKLRQWIGELLGAIRPAYGILSKATGSQTLNIAPQPLVFDTQQLSPVIDYTLTPATGTAVRNEKGTVKITFSAGVLVGTARQTIFTLFKNGVATPWKVSAQGAGATNPVEVSLSVIEYQNGIGTYQMQVASDANSTATTLSNLVMVIETVPVWEFT